jgi:hypothetical protein
MTAACSLLAAGHMISALVFLDWLPADGTLFGIRQNPGYVLTFR